MGFDSFHALIRRDLEEFFATGIISTAKTLTEQMHWHFNHTTYPMYFTGDLEAPLVLIHLNPKQRNTYQERYTGSYWLDSVESYLQYHRSFGRIHYGSEAQRSHKSPFDHKQIRFLKPFGQIAFLPETSPIDRWTNLERVVDDKLQLELIPYGSDSFPTHGWNTSILEPYIHRLIDVITARPRNYVLFCGNIFAELFKQHITQTYTFHLTKKDGSPAQKKARFSAFTYPYQGSLMRAGIAHSFAQQGIPMDAYGTQCKWYYDQAFR